MSVSEQGLELREAQCREIAESAITQYDALLARTDTALQSATMRKTVRPLLVLRSGLVQYLGAAYFLRDSVRFRAAAAAFTSHSVALAETFAPEPFVLLPDLCLALIGGPPKTRRVLIQTVWKQSASIRPADDAGQLAHILSSLADLNRQAAADGVDALRVACREREFDRRRTRYLLTWALAARRVNTGATERLARAIHMLDRRNAALVGHEVARLAGGGSSAITAAAFLDLPAAALGALGAATLAPSQRQASEASSYADYVWISEAAWG